MHINEEDVMLFACISTPFMLLALAHAIKAQLCVELNGDCTGGFVQEFVDLLAFVVPDCRGSFHVWGTALTHDKEWTGPIKGHYTKADSGIPFLFRS